LKPNSPPRAPLPKNSSPPLLPNSPEPLHACQLIHELCSHRATGPVSRLHSPIRTDQRVCAGGSGHAAVFPNHAAECAFHGFDPGAAGLHPARAGSGAEHHRDRSARIFASLETHPALTLSIYAQRNQQTYAQARRLERRPQTSRHMGHARAARPRERPFTTQRPRTVISSTPAARRRMAVARCWKLIGARS